MDPPSHGHCTCPKLGIELVHAGILAAPKVKGGAALARASSMAARNMATEARPETLDRIWPPKA